MNLNKFDDKFITITGNANQELAARNDDCPSNKSSNIFELPLASNEEKSCEGLSTDKTKQVVKPIGKTSHAKEKPNYFNKVEKNIFRALVKFGLASIAA